MKSRVEKYSNNFTTENRTERHKELYREASKTDLNVTRTYSNSKVIDEANKTIDIEKIRRYIEKVNDKENNTSRTRINDIKIEATIEEPKEEEKDYDINSVLEKARSKREIDYEQARSRKLNHSYEDIINEIQKFNNTQNVEKDEEELNTNEQTLVNLINTISMNKKERDLFEELKGSENTQVLGNIKDLEKDEEFKNQIRNQINEKEDFSISFDKTLDSVTRDLNKEKEETKPEIKVTKEEPKEITKTMDSFYTTSDIFDKKDFEESNSSDDDEDEEGHSILKTIGLVIAVLVLIVVLIVIANYVFELGLF